MCEYCDLTKYTETYVDDRDDMELSCSNYTYLSIKYDKANKKYYLYASGDDSCEIEINHCPMCGRELK